MTVTTETLINGGAVGLLVTLVISVIAYLRTRNDRLEIRVDELNDKVLDAVKSSADSYQQANLARSEEMREIGQTMEAMADAISRIEAAVSRPRPPVGRG